MFQSFDFIFRFFDCFVDFNLLFHIRFKMIQFHLKPLFSVAQNVWCSAFFTCIAIFFFFCWLNRESLGYYRPQQAPTYMQWRGQNEHFIRGDQKGYGGKQFEMQELKSIEFISLKYEENVKHIKHCFNDRQIFIDSKSRLKSNFTSGWYVRKEQLELQSISVVSNSSFGMEDRIQYSTNKFSI